METEQAIHFVQLAQRTLANYDFVYSTRERDTTNSVPLFEVTQLITGLIGIFVWPKEEYFGYDVTNNRIIKWDELKKNLSGNFPLNYLRDQDMPLNQPKTITAYLDLIWNLRNGFAHGNFEFLSDQGVIRDIQIWNTPPNRTNCIWRGTINIKDLEEIARYFVCVLNKSTLKEYQSSQGDIPVFRCSECDFVWINDEERRPDKCVCCKKVANWEDRKERLSFATAIQPQNCP